MNDERTRIEVYNLKYALTKTGVFKVQGHDDGKYFHIKKDNGQHVGLLGRSQWAATEAEAVEKVKAMLKAKFAALEAERLRMVQIRNLLNAGGLPIATNS